MLRFSSVLSPTVLIPKPHGALARKRRGFAEGTLGLQLQEQEVLWDTSFPSGFGVSAQLFPHKALECKDTSDFLKAWKGFTTGRPHPRGSE